MRPGSLISRSAITFPEGNLFINNRRVEKHCLDSLRAECLEVTWRWATEKSALTMSISAPVLFPACLKVWTAAAAQSAKFLLRASQGWTLSCRKRSLKMAQKVLPCRELFYLPSWSSLSSEPLPLFLPDSPARGLNCLSIPVQAGVYAELHPLHGLDHF